MHSQARRPRSRLLAAKTSGGQPAASSFPRCRVNLQVQAIGCDGGDEQLLDGHAVAAEHGARPRVTEWRKQLQAALGEVVARAGNMPVLHNRRLASLSHYRGLPQ